MPSYNAPPAAAMTAQDRWIGEHRCGHHSVAWHAMPLLTFVLADHGDDTHIDEWKRLFLPDVEFGTAGDYIWFVDARDRVLDLGAVLDKLRTDQPDVLRIGKGHEPWSTVVRRGLKPGWPAILTAKNVATVSVSVYERRARTTPDEFFAHYDEAFEYAGDKKPKLSQAMLHDGLQLLAEAKDEREFFHQLATRLQKHGAPPGRAAGLVKSDNYAGYRALQRALATRTSVKKRVGKAKGRAGARRVERHYRKALRAPIEQDLAVFAAYWYRGYSCNPRAIYEKAQELVPGMRGVWVVKKGAEKGLPQGVDYVISRTPEYYEAIARARYLVNNVNFPNHLVKREGQTHVMTHHGTPLKKMGLDQRATHAGETLDFDALLKRCSRWDFSVAANVFSTLVWEGAYPLRYESLETGYPRNDVLANATEDDVRQAREKLGIEPGQTAVLYAPTHREWHGGFEPVLNIAQVAEQLGEDHVLLSRAHYFYDRDPRVKHVGVRDVSNHPSVEELMLAANALVTDYSSIMFDYAILDRPIVIHAPDWDTYRRLRGTYFDLMEERPGPVAKTPPEVARAIAAGDTAPDLRQPFRARFCDLEDGRAAERVVKRVWFGERVDAPAREPAAAA